MRLAPTAGKLRAGRFGEEGRRSRAFSRETANLEEVIPLSRDGQKVTVQRSVALATARLRPENGSGGEPRRREAGSYRELKPERSARIPPRHRRSHRHAIDAGLLLNLPQAILVEREGLSWRPALKLDLTGQPQQPVLQHRLRLTER
jgi:hypothetical protein